MLLKRGIIFLYFFSLCQSIAIAQTDNTLQQPIQTFLNTLEQRFDVHFIHETGTFDGSSFTYTSDLLDKSIKEILQTFQEKTAFKAIQIPQMDDSTLVFAVKREDSKVKIKGRIIDQDNEHLPYSTVRVPKLGVGTVSDFNGYYELEIDAGNHDIEASFVGYKPTEVSIDIAPGAEGTVDFILEAIPFLDEIVITGSRNAIPGELGVGSSIIEHGTIANLINLKGREIDAYVELTEALHVQQPSFHSVHQHISDGTDHIDPATLRGMSPDQTLILINGKRKHQSAFLNISNTVGKGSVFTDLNTIPLSIIERIEILQDGASSQYGSDAIAGVVNVILKKKSYSEVNIKSGISQDGDGFIYDLGSNFGFNLNDNGAFINISLNHSERSPVNRTLDYGGRIFINPEMDDNEQSRDDFFQSISLNQGDSTEFVTRFGQSKLVTSRLFANADIPINKTTNFYSFGGYTFKQGGSVGVYRFPFQLAVPNVPNSAGFSPQLDTDITDQIFTLGLKKAFNNGVLDISNTWGRNGIVYNILDPAGDIGPESQADVEAGEVLYGQNTTNIDYSHLLESLPMTVNAGAEFRIENYTQNAGEDRIAKIDEIANIENENLQLFPRFNKSQELNEYRTNIGVYLDLEADPSKQLRLGLSGRFERYDDFGSNFTWKVFSRWNPSDNVSFKFSYNTGFRAPSLHQYFYTSRLNQFVPTVNGFRAAVVDQYNHSDTSIPPLSALDVDPLKAESSSSFNIGFIVRPSKGFSVSTNVYRIDVNDRIILTGRISDKLSSEIGEVLARSNSTDVQFFTNAIGTTTTGLEFITRYYIPFAGSKGSIDFTLSGHVNDVEVRDDKGTRLPGLNETLQSFENVIFNRFEVGLFESAQPNSKLIFASSLHRGKFNLHGRFTRYGSITYLHPLDGNSNNFVENELTGIIETRDQIFNGKVLTDLSTQISFTDNFSLSLGVNNVFNVFPDENQHSANREGDAFPYNRFIQQFGTRGRFGYANLNIRF